jgi:hypothetical protein
VRTFGFAPNGNQTGAEKSEKKHISEKSFKKNIFYKKDTGFKMKDDIAKSNKIMKKAKCIVDYKHFTPSIRGVSKRQVAP